MAENTSNKDSREKAEEKADDKAAERADEKARAEAERRTADDIRAQREAAISEVERREKADPRAPEEKRADEKRADDLRELAMHRDVAAARTRGAEPLPPSPYDEDTPKVGPTGQPLIWVMSNRRDNRVVAWWRDPAQPGGEAFVGPGPELVAVTPEVERLLLSGEAIEVPEPMRYLPHPEKPDEVQRDEHGHPVKNPHYPIKETGVLQAEFAAQPGRPVPLNREPAPELFHPDAIRTIRQKQRRIPAELPPPAGGVVPGVTHVVV